MTDIHTLVVRLTETVPVHDHARLFQDTIATVQRGAPEQAMLVVQNLLGGGVLNPVVEHTGDLLHRMTEIVTSDTGGYGFVRPKVERVLFYLTNTYGFEREMEENFQHNADAGGISVDEFRARIVHALDDYANAFRPIPTYNQVQRCARSAAIAVGEQRWNDAIQYLRSLQKVLKQGRAAWTAAAQMYEPHPVHEADETTSVGNVKNYSWQQLLKLQHAKDNTLVGTLGDYLVGTKIRALYAPALATPVAAYDRLLTDPKYQRFGAENAVTAAVGQVNGRTVIFVARTQSVSELVQRLLEEGAHVLRTQKGRRPSIPAVDLITKEEHDALPHEQSAERLVRFAMTLKESLSIELQEMARAPRVSGLCEHDRPDLG